MSSIHLLEGLILVLAALFVYRIGQRLHSPGVGLLAALLYGLSATLLYEWWDRGQAEIYMGLTGAIAVWRWLAAWPGPAPARPPGLPIPEGAQTQHPPHVGDGKQSSRLFPLVVCGAFCGLTIYFKPSGVFVLAGLGLATIWATWAQGLRRVAQSCLALAGGFVLSFLPLIGYFAANGALVDFYQTVIVFNSYHARIGGNPTLAGSVTGTLDFLAAMNILSPLALVGVWSVVGTLRWTRALGWPDDAAPPAEASIPGAAGRPALPYGAAVVLLVWLIASAAGIWTQGKFFSYHWSPVLPPLAVLAAWGAAVLAHDLRAARKVPGRLLIAGVGLVVLAVYAVALLQDHAPKWARDARYLLGQTSSDVYLASFGHNIQERDKYSFSETLTTARYLQANTGPHDYVLVWGFQALVNFLADRPAPTRYIFTYPLTFDRPESEFRVQARRIFLRDLKEKPPRYIVLVTNDVNPLQAVDSYALLAGFPEFERIVQREYRIETTIGEFHLYRRSDAQL
jgi:4-amino-4-deoxy-L-arabinose transferase-like glycosyltransferase